MLVNGNHLVQSDNANHRLLSAINTGIDEAQLPVHFVLLHVTELRGRQSKLFAELHCYKGRRWI